MKHNDKNIIAQGQPGVIGSSRDQSYTSENKSTLDKLATKGVQAEVIRRPVAANNPNNRTKGQGAHQTSSMSNSIEVPTQSLIPALNLPDNKNYTLGSLSNDGVFDPRLAEAGHVQSPPGVGQAHAGNMHNGRVGNSMEIGNQSLLQNQILQEFNRKPIVGGGQALDQSLNTQLASQQFLSNVEFNNVATAE